MQRAIISDQAVINDAATMDVTYVDNDGSGVTDIVLLEDLSLLYDNKKAILTAEDRANADRIINNKEENSYVKLYKYLQSK
jgi:hypothetical protein